MERATLPNGRPDRLFVPNKDDNFEYRWCNKSDRNMYETQWEGWEPAPVDPSILPPGVMEVGQQLSDPAGGQTYVRGDLILMRMPRERYEKNIVAPAQAARERQNASIDTMVSQANETSRKQLRDRGQKNIPRELVFRENVGDPLD